MLHQNFILMTVSNSPVNGKFQGLFMVFECFSSTFQGKFNFQGLIKTVRYIHYSSTFKSVQTIASDFVVQHEHNGDFPGEAIIPPMRCCFIILCTTYKDKYVKQIKGGN